MRLDIERIWLERRKTAVFVTVPEAVLLAGRVAVMPPRPGRIDGVLEVDRQPPRCLEVQESPSFAGYLAEITRLFRARGVVHD